MSVYGFLHGIGTEELNDGNGTEEPKYGLYSYALFPVPSVRAEDFLKELFKTTKAAVEFAGVIDPLQLNVIYLPTKEDQLAISRRYESRSPPAASFAIEVYDYTLASVLLVKICAEPDERVRELCEGAISGGPYLFSYARPASTLDTIPPPYLFVDLSDVHELAFGEFIDAYKAQVKRTDIADLERIETLRLGLLSIVLEAADWVTPINKAVADIVHIGK